MPPDISEYLRASNGDGEAVRAIVVSEREVGSIEINVDSTLNWPSKFIATSGMIDPSTDTFDTDTVTVFFARKNNNFIEIDGYAPGYSDIGHHPNEIIVIKPTTPWSDAVADTVGAMQAEVDTIPTKVEASLLPIRIDATKTKVGIGKIPENGALDVDGDIYSNGEKVVTAEATEVIDQTSRVTMASGVSVVAFSAVTYGKLCILSGYLTKSGNWSNANAAFTVPSDIAPGSIQSGAIYAVGQGAAADKVCRLYFVDNTLTVGNPSASMPNMVFQFNYIIN